MGEKGHPVELENQLFLQRLLSYPNPRTEEYRHIYKGEARSKWYRYTGPEQGRYTPIYEAYAELALTHPEARGIKYFRSKIADTMVVDIGGGVRPEVPVFAQRYGADKYMCVDKYLLRDEKQDPFTDVTKKLRIKSVDSFTVLYIQDDALDFISRMRDCFCTVLLNGIDHIVMPSDSYRKALVNEIARMMRAGSIVMGNDLSQILDDCSGVPGLRKVDAFGQYRINGLIIYEKTDDGI